MPDDEYAATAQYYDLFHAAAFAARARQHVVPHVRSAVRGVLDVGAGSGAVTAEIARAVPSGAPVYAVEPAPAMRTALMTRLAQDPLLRERVTVLPDDVLDVDLPEPVDVAVLLDVVGLLDPDRRPDVWDVVARQLVPGGLLVLDGLVAADRSGSSPRREALPEVVVGTQTYTGEVRTVRLDVDRERFTYRYRSLRAGVLLDEVEETFELWLLRRDDVLGELADAGFALVSDDDAVTVLCRCGPPALAAEAGQRADALAPGQPGDAPVATGRLGSVTHSDHEPA